VKVASPDIFNQPQGGNMIVKYLMELVGVTGTLIVCLSIIPQIAKTLRTKRATDISIIYLVTMMSGLVLLTVYSIYKEIPVFIFGNVISMASVGTLIVLKLKYYRNNLYVINRRAIHYKERRRKDVTDNDAFTGYGKSGINVQKP